MKIHRKISILVVTLFGLEFMWTTKPALAQVTNGTSPRHKLSAPDDDTPTSTTLDIDDGAFLGYGGARWGTHSIGSKWIPANGFRGMWLFRESIAFGVDLGGLASRYHPFQDAARQDLTLSLATWGLAIEEIYSPRSEFHHHYGLTIGRASARLSYLASDATYSKGGRMFYFVTPEASVRWNLTKYTRPFAGVSFRLPFGGKGNSEIKESQFFGGSIFLGVNVGNFTI